MPSRSLLSALRGSEVGRYLSEQLLAAPSRGLGEVDDDVVVLCRDRLLYKRLVECVPVYFDSVVREHYLSCNTKV